MKKLLLGLLLIAAPVLASGPKYHFDDPKLNDELANIYKDLKYIRAVSVTAATGTFTNLSFSSVTTQEVPPGVVHEYAGTSVPTGYLLCDGAAVSRTTYAALFAVIGEAYGEGNNSTTFNLPDMRGKFARGHDNGAGNDPDAASRTACNTGGNTGDNVGSCQADIYGEHNHGVTDPEHTHAQQQATAGGAINGASTNSLWDGSSFITSTLHTGTSSTGISINDSGGNETRPKNVYFKYIIKT